MFKYFFLPLLLLSCTQLPKENKMNEKYLYLEEIQGDRSIEFAKDFSKNTTDKYQNDPRFEKMKMDILENLNDPDKIPYGSIHGDYLYNYWKDKKNPRGIWRRMPLAKYIKGLKSWETLIDLDKLAKKENKNWIWKGPSFEETKKRKAIISLSIGGKDATHKREFNLITKKFVQNGFNIPEEGKNHIVWINENEVFLRADYGPATLTKAGYPRQTRVWKRGEDYKKAKLINEIPKEFSYSWPWRDPIAEKTIFIISPEWYKNEYYSYNQTNHKLTKFPLPLFIEIENRLGDHLIGTTRETWNVNGQEFHPGDLFSLNETKIEKGIIEAQLIFRPTKTQAVQRTFGTKNRLYISLLNNVKQEIHFLDNQAGKWRLQQLELPIKYATSYLHSVQNSRSDFFISQEGFLQPETLYYFKDNNFKLVRKQKSLFDTKDLVVEQHFAKSKDGTMVPYFQVSQKNLKLDGSNPTEIYAYGGFQHSQLPYYPKAMGKYWLQKGAVFVLANIRGGSEYGTRWHKDALKEKRQNAFNDFYAIAEDLIARKVSSPKKLAIKGGSNGGLLTTVALTQRPDLYGAVISAVPLTDMERFHKLLAGHSWVGEYGNPDNKNEREYLLNYSPFHQLKEDVDYPTPFISTSTLDDRVHPGHARKFVAKMKDLGHQVHYFENMEGGHAGASNYEQWASKIAMEYLYLYEQLDM